MDILFSICPCVSSHTCCVYGTEPDIHHMPMQSFQWLHVLLWYPSGFVIRLQLGLWKVFSIHMLPISICIISSYTQHLCISLLFEVHPSLSHSPSNNRAKPHQGQHMGWSWRFWGFHQRSLKPPWSHSRRPKTSYARDTHWGDAKGVVQQPSTNAHIVVRQLHMAHCYWFLCRLEESTPYPCWCFWWQSPLSPSRPPSDFNEVFSFVLWNCSLFGTNFRCTQGWTSSLPTSCL